MPITNTRRLSARYDLRDTSCFLSSTSSPQVIPTPSLVGGICLLFCLSDVDARDPDDPCDISGRGQSATSHGSVGVDQMTLPGQDKTNHTIRSSPDLPPWPLLISRQYYVLMLCTCWSELSAVHAYRLTFPGRLRGRFSDRYVTMPSGCTQIAHRTSGAAAAAKSPLTLAASVPRSAGPDSNRRTHHIGGSKGRWPP